MRIHLLVIALILAALPSSLQSQSDKEPELRGELEFHLWKKPNTQFKASDLALSPEEAERMRAELNAPEKGTFLIGDAESKTEVDYIRGRKTQPISYVGPKSCTIYKETGNPDAPYQAIGSFELVAGNGNYLILLQPAPNGRFDAIPIPHSRGANSSSLTLINLASETMGIEINGTPMTIDTTKQKSLQLPENQDSTLIELFAKSENEWDKLLARRFVLHRDKKSVLVIFNAPSKKGNIGTILFSGIDRAPREEP